MTFDNSEFDQIFRTQHDRADLTFWNERKPLFSAASPAQEPMNRSGLWFRWAETFIPWQYKGDWMTEAQALQRAAFIGDWSAISKVDVSGRDADKFLQSIGVTDLSSLAVGRLRHFIMVNENGKVAAEGVLIRMGHNDFRYTGGGGEWILYQAQLASFSVRTELVTAKNFIFEIQGTASVRILEKIADRSIAALEFNGWLRARIAGADVLILRTGISGELGYEIHGASADAEHVWSTCVTEGDEFGLTPIGVRNQALCHIESGIASVGIDYLPSHLGTPAAANTSAAGPNRPIFSTYPISDASDLFRSPFELNWGSRKVVERCEFLGVEALREEIRAGGPQRRLVGLRWNSEDVIDIYASLFKDGDIEQQMDMPRRGLVAEYFGVSSGGQLCGTASSRVYSPTVRSVISLAVLDQEVIGARDEVTVRWGAGEGPQTDIRAEIVDLPFKPDNRRTDPRTVLG